MTFDMISVSELLPVIFGLVGIVAGVLTKWATSRPHTTLPGVITWFIRRVVRRLPAESRERFADEWIAEATAAWGESKLEAVRYALLLVKGVSSIARDEAVRSQAAKATLIRMVYWTVYWKLLTPKPDVYLLPGKPRHALKNPDQDRD